MEEKKVSVIIPLYNRKHLIGRCVRSVQNQTYRHLEIIIVDDGSTDEPDEVLAALAQDERVRVIRKPNGGVSSARNAGLDAATGEYVQFLDSDDELFPQAIRSTTELMIARQVNCVIFNLSTDRSSLMPRLGAGESCLFDSLREYMAHCSGPGGVCSPVNKLFHRHLISSSRFPSGVSMGEDMIFNYIVLSQGGRIAYLNTCLYKVDTSLAQSLSRRYDERCMEDIRAQWTACQQYMVPLCTEEKKHYWASFFWVCYIEAVRKLCLKSGYSLKRVQQRLKEWREDEMIRSFPISAMPSLPEFRLLHAGFFRLMWVVIHLRHVKDVLRARFF